MTLVKDPIVSFYENTNDFLLQVHAHIGILKIVNFPVILRLSFLLIINIIATGLKNK